MPGGRWLKLEGEGNFLVVFLPYREAATNRRRVIALTSYCNAKQGGMIRPAWPSGAEYQQVTVVSAEGMNQTAAWYSLAAALNEVLADIANEDWRYGDGEN